MVTPKTYIGYDSDGNRKASCTARNANDIINPSEVQSAIDNVQSVTEQQIYYIRAALYNIAPDAGASLVIQGTNLEGTMADLSDAMSEVPASITDSINVLYTEAVRIHDILQEQENDDAYNVVRRAEGVSYVR